MTKNETKITEMFDGWIMMDSESMVGLARIMLALLDRLVLFPSSIARTLKKTCSPWMKLFRFRVSSTLLKGGRGSIVQSRSAIVTLAMEEEMSRLFSSVLFSE